MARLYTRDFLPKDGEKAPSHKSAGMNHRLTVKRP